MKDLLNKTKSQYYFEFFTDWLNITPWNSTTLLTTILNHLNDKSNAEKRGWRIKTKNYQLVFFIQIELGIGIDEVDLFFLLII